MDRAKAWSYKKQKNQFYVLYLFFFKQYAYPNLFFALFSSFSNTL